MRSQQGLLELERFHCQQIRHWVMHPTIQPLAQRHLTAFEKWLLSKTDDTHLISQLYGLMRQDPTPHKTPSQRRWEVELEWTLTQKE